MIYLTEEVLGQSPPPPTPGLDPATARPPGGDVELTSVSLQKKYH